MQTAKRSVWIASLLLTAMALPGCGDSTSSPSPTTTSAHSRERIGEDLRAAGSEIKDAASQAAQEVRPALERAKEEGRQVIHNTAERVANSTTSQPAPQ